MGDYNEVCSLLEVVEGEYNEVRATNMTYMIDDCNFIDLGAVGSKFTWEKRENGVRTIAKRLDRALGDISWRHVFPEAYVEHLPSVYSDHSPLLVCCDADQGDYLSRPFRFQAAWTTRPRLRALDATNLGATPRIGVRKVRDDEGSVDPI